MTEKTKEQCIEEWRGLQADGDTRAEQIENLEQARDLIDDLIESVRVGDLHFCMYLRIDKVSFDDLATCIAEGEDSAVISAAEISISDACNAVSKGHVGQLLASAEKQMVPHKMRDLVNGFTAWMEDRGESLDDGGLFDGAIDEGND